MFVLLLLKLIGKPSSLGSMLLGFVDCISSCFSLTRRLFKSDGEQLDLPFLDDAEEQDEEDEDEDEDEELDEDEDRDDVGMRMFLDSSFWTGLNAEL